MEHKTNPTIQNDQIDDEIKEVSLEISKCKDSYETIKNNLKSLEQQRIDCENKMATYSHRITNLCRKKFNKFLGKYVKISQVYFNNGDEEVTYGLLENIGTFGDYYKVEGMFLDYIPGKWNGGLIYKSDINLSDGKFTIEEVDESVIKEQIAEHEKKMFEKLEERKDILKKCKKK